MTCWNQTGVHGDSSCAELPAHGHCRDCPTYRTAAARLLDMAVSADDLADAAAHLAREKPVLAARARAVVIFRVGATWLALPGTAIQEIVAPRAIHSVPHRRNGAVLGLVNIRGELLVCVALRFVLSLEAAAGRDRAQPSPQPGLQPSGAAPPRMLVTQQDGSRVVYPVDEVFGIARFTPQDHETAPALVAKAPVSFTQAVLSWRGNPVSLLDEQSLLAAVNRSLALATAI